MKRSVIFFCILIITLFTTSIYAQVTPIEPEDEEEETEKTDAADQAGKDKFLDRLVFGGNFGLSFGNYTFVDLSPLVGYKITKKLTSGVGFTYQFEKYKDPYNNPFNYVDDYKASTIGGKVFSQYDILYGIFAHAEYELLSIEYEFLETPYETGKFNVPGLYLGGGYNLKIGDNSALQIMALYNFLSDQNNILYDNPLTFRIGFLGGL
ncbi:MAG: hypothetical protein H7Y00_13435 [Fimbriimonadaceae bacterium]|nr:hypothetical protein [Chitinophagales bacterium]